MTDLLDLPVKLFPGAGALHAYPECPEGGDLPERYAQQVQACRKAGDRLHGPPCPKHLRPIRETRSARDVLSLGCSECMSSDVSVLRRWEPASPALVVATRVAWSSPGGFLRTVDRLVDQCVQQVSTTLPSPHLRGYRTLVAGREDVLRFAATTGPLVEVVGPVTSLAAAEVFASLWDPASGLAGDVQQLLQAACDVVASGPQ